MSEQRRRYLVTSALPYANGPLHVGQISGAYLPADAFVRYLRARGEDVVYACGTDEHGVPITLTAEREGKDPQEVVDYWWANMKETFERFGISFDNFSRTSTPLHAKNTQLFYQKLKEGGYISEDESKQMYSPTEGRFLPDRYVEGTCPVCGYKEARGDQCDNCGSWYEAYELIEPHSKITGGPVEEPETRLVHFIGKDNTVFHAVVWPAMLMGTGESGEEPFILPHDVLANEFMNLEVVINGVPRAMQMSTSRNLAVWLHEALDDFPADLLRFYLASILPETNDVNFSWREFQERVNSDLIGNLGNYINRTLSFMERYFDGKATRPKEPSESAREALADFRELEQRYEARMRAGRPRDALGELLAMGRRANRFFDSEAPWKSRKEDPDQARRTLYI